jgi:hypothetical protein
VVGVVVVVIRVYGGWGGGGRWHKVWRWFVVGFVVGGCQGRQ